MSAVASVFVPMKLPRTKTCAPFPSVAPLVIIRPPAASFPELTFPSPAADSGDGRIFGEHRFSAVACLRRAVNNQRAFYIRQPVAQNNRFYAAAGNVEIDRVAPGAVRVGSYQSSPQRTIVRRAGAAGHRNSLRVVLPVNHKRRGA